MIINWTVTIIIAPIAVGVIILILALEMPFDIDRLQIVPINIDIRLVGIVRHINWCVISVGVH